MTSNNHFFFLLIKSVNFTWKRLKIMLKKTIKIICFITSTFFFLLFHFPSLGIFLFPYNTYSNICRCQVGELKDMKRFMGEDLIINTLDCYPLLCWNMCQTNIHIVPSVPTFIRDIPVPPDANATITRSPWIQWKYPLPIQTTYCPIMD